MLISADYSQIELRVLAHLSGDEALIDAFQRGEDIHDRTALAIFGADSGLDRKEMRTRGEDGELRPALRQDRVHAGSKDIGVTQQAAQAFIDAYFAGFPGVRAFIDRTLEDARGDRRREDAVRAAAAGARGHQPQRPGAAGGRADRGQHAHPGHGRRHPEAGDDRRPRALERRPAGPDGRRARMILTVHDELLFEVPREEADEVAALVRRSMEGAADLAVPLTVDVGIGENWKEAKR